MKQIACRLSNAPVPIGTNEGFRLRAPASGLVAEFASMAGCAPSTQTLEARWQPYVGMVYFHLLLKRLEDAHQLVSQYAGTGGT
jgi:hypothetical protein